MNSAEQQARSIRERGYAIFESICPDDEVDFIRRGIESRIEELRPPAFYSPAGEPLGDTARITPSGLALMSLLSERPELADRVLRAPVVESLRAYFGDEPRLDLSAALISDSSRPFFSWHSHLNGVDTGEYERVDSWPPMESPERVLALLYLDDLNDDTGPLLLQPRALGDPTRPPADLYAPNWPGQLEVRVPRGSVVVLEQCTWHAAQPRSTPGLRMLAASYFRAARVTRPDWADPRLASLAQSHPSMAWLVGA